MRLIRIMQWIQWGSFSIPFCKYRQTPLILCPSPSNKEGVSFHSSSPFRRSVTGYFCRRFVCDCATRIFIPRVIDSPHFERRAITNPSNLWKRNPSCLSLLWLPRDCFLVSVSLVKYSFFHEIPVLIIFSYFTKNIETQKRTKISCRAKNASFLMKIHCVM